jgi:hypothetical protein
LPTFRRYVLHSSSQSKSGIVDVSMVHVASIRRVTVDSSDGGSVELRNFDNISRIHNLPNPSSRTKALGSTRPLTEMSTRNILGMFLRVNKEAGA